jgi:CRP/FNR family transcriptional regulator
MISPELLRYYPYFSRLDEAQLIKVAIISDEESFENGAVIFQEGDIANALYFLLDGQVDLFYTLSGMKNSPLEKGIPVGEINPGEPFGISALIEPYMLTATSSVYGSARVIKIDASELRAMFKEDRRLAYFFIHQAAKAAIERLHATRIQLAAAWA